MHDTLFWLKVRLRTPWLINAHLPCILISIKSSLCLDKRNLWTRYIGFKNQPLLITLPWWIQGKITTKKKEKKRLSHQSSGAKGLKLLPEHLLERFFLVCFLNAMLLALRKNGLVYVSSTSRFSKNSKPYAFQSYGYTTL